LAILCPKGEAFFPFPRVLIQGDILNRLASAQAGADRLFLALLNYATLPSGRSQEVSGLVTAGRDTLKREAHLGSDQYDRCVALLLKGSTTHGIAKLIGQRKAKVSGARGAFYFRAAGLVELRQQALATKATHLCEKAVKQARWTRNLADARLKRWPTAQHSKKGRRVAANPRRTHG
jgi:hypothetical protein